MHGFNDFRRKREIPSKTEKRNILVRHNKKKKSEIIKYLISRWDYNFDLRICQINIGYVVVVCMLCISSIL